VTAVIVLTTLPDIDLQISNNGPLFQMTRTERVLCEFPTKDIGPKWIVVWALAAMRPIPQDQHERMHFVAEHRQTLDLATRIINQE
jgi:hypothetical protein